MLLTVTPVVKVKGCDKEQQNPTVKALLPAGRSVPSKTAAWDIVAIADINRSAGKEWRTGASNGELKRLDTVPTLPTTYEELLQCHT